MLRRSLVCWFFVSLSSGGSESGLEVAVKGLDGALPGLEAVALKRESLLGVPVLTWVGFLVAPRGGVEGVFFPRSQKSSYGRMTRV